MRRLLSILLLAVFSLPLLAPLLAPGQGGEAGLPACCRRNGTHHCTMSVGERRQLAHGQEPRFQGQLETCPYCPASVASVHAPAWGVLAPGQAIFAATLSHPSGSPQTESKRRLARDRSRQKRGPPSLLG